jgi:HD-GYP domain-containing protein (c-di-GMP phosphodiesterase class II)
MRILSIEDSSDDFELIKATLQKGGIDAECIRVENAEEMRNALSGPIIDLFLSDYNMPQFSAEEALDILRQKSDEAPFILVSGKIGEEAAIKLMKMGANDYISKEHLDLLPSAIRRAEHEYANRVARNAAEEALRYSEAQLRQVVDLMPQLIYVKDWDENVIMCNTAFRVFYGFDKGSSTCLTDSTIGDDREVMTEGKSITITQTVKNAVGDSRELGITKVPYIYIGQEGLQTHAVLCVSQDLTDTIRMERVKQETLKKLELTVAGTVNVIMAISNLRDPYTAGHELRVTKLALAIGNELGFEKPALSNLETAAKLHDVGKIAVPSEILNKPGRLSDAEMGIIKVHAQYGYDVLKESGLDAEISLAAGQHHERNDGSGYPHALKEKDISITARILAVADVVEAMSSHRPYRAALGIDAALEEIKKNRGRLYTPEIVDICVDLFTEKEFSFT